MIGLLLVLLLGIGLMGLAIVVWSSERVLDWALNTYQPRTSRGPFRRRTRQEAQTGLRGAAVLIGVAAGFLIVISIVSLI